MGFLKYRQAFYWVVVMSCHVCYVYRKSLGQHLTLSGEATQYQTGMASLNPYLVIYIFCHLTLETAEGKKIINHAIIVVLNKLWDFRGTSVLPSQLFIECLDFWEK